MAVAERNAFELAGRAANGIGLAERNVMRRLAFENEVGGLCGRERFVAAKPNDERTVDHLDGAVFCGPLYVFVDFTGASGSYSPTGRTLIVAGYDESPSWKEAFPGGYFDRDSVFHAFKGMVNSPVELGVVGFGRRTGPVCIGRMVMRGF